MKNNIVLVCFLISLNFANSQELRGYIEYSLSFNDDKELSTGAIGNYFNSAKDNAKYIKFILEFNKQEMCFYSKTMSVDGVNINFSIAFSGVNGIYYRKANENTVLNYRDNPMIGKAIVQENIKVDWKFHNVTKKIQDFLCYKASAIIIVDNGDKKFEKNLVVWYCPTIPYSYGPKGYNALSGMILEYQYDFTIIGAKKIVFDKNSKVTIPTGGKLMTSEEYSNL